MLECKKSVYAIGKEKARGREGERERRDLGATKRGLYFLCEYNGRVLVNGDKHGRVEG